MFLNEVLKEMKKLDSNNNPIAFSIAYRTFNKQNKSGGKLVIVQKAVSMNPPKVKGKVRLSQNTPFKNPNHYTNKTRNIKTAEGIKKINILFIDTFNGYKVIL